MDVGLTVSGLTDVPTNHTGEKSSMDKHSSRYSEEISGDSKEGGHCVKDKSSGWSSLEGKRPTPELGGGKLKRLWETNMGRLIGRPKKTGGGAGAKHMVLGWSHPGSTLWAEVFTLSLRRGEIV